MAPVIGVPRTLGQMRQEKRISLCLSNADLCTEAERIARHSDAEDRPDRAGAFAARFDPPSIAAYHPSVQRTLIPLILLLTPTLLFAWTPAAEQRIAATSTRLAPPDLRMLIEKYSFEYKQGLTRAAADEGTDSHRYAVTSRRGRLEQRLENDIRSAITMIRKRDSLANLVETLGVIAHFVSDANNPFHLDDSDPRMAGCQQDYEAYFEREMRKFPVVFYGVQPRLVPKQYIEQMFARTARFYPLVSEEFYRFGERRSASEFDDRSTAFGVASVCYSRAITDTVNLYYYIWGEAGGDVRRADRLRRGAVLSNER